jgi:GNAT superfamily N-acetyltransferase
MPPPAIDIRTVHPDEWMAVRDLRLRALTEDATAFGQTLEQAHALGEHDWRRYVGDGSSTITFVATRDGRFVGISWGRALGDGDAGLYGMWVAPEARRRGVGRRLVQSVLDWARTRGVRRVVLDVAEGRAPAHALYAACGFVETGRTAPCESHPGVMEREMACALGAAPS